MNKQSKKAKTMKKTGSVTMTDETPDDICRGCGYHLKNCLGLKACKELLDGIFTHARPSTGAHLMYFA